MQMIDELIGKTLSDKYKIEDVISIGEAENVYRGRHILMDKPVAIRVLAAELAETEKNVEEFWEQARAISRLAHPNILNVTDFGKDDSGVAFVVMEDAQGKTLADEIAGTGAIDVKRAVRIAKQTAAALSSAHANSIIHPNLSTKNILLTKMANGTELVKVSGFGGADSPSDKSDENALEDGDLFDHQYRAPEEFGSDASDKRSNVYSLGIVLFEMLTGEVPFKAETWADLALKHQEVPPPPFAAYRVEVPEDVEPLVIRSLAKKPDARPQSVNAFAKELTEAANIGHEEDSLIIPAFDATYDSTPPNHLWKTAFIVLAAISLLSLGLFYANDYNRSDTVNIPQTDADGLPVQPLNPATGASERDLQGAVELGNSLGPADQLIRNDAGGVGEGNPIWDRGGAPVGSGGNIVTIPPNSGSPFTNDAPVGYDRDGNPIYLVEGGDIAKRNPKATTTPSPTKSPDAAKPTGSPTVKGEKKTPVTKPPEKPKPEATKQEKKAPSPAPDKKDGNS